jgi:hypothetical protein
LPFVFGACVSAAQIAREVERARRLHQQSEAVAPARSIHAPLSDATIFSVCASFCEIVFLAKPQDKPLRLHFVVEIPINLVGTPTDVNDVNCIKRPEMFIDFG